MIDIVSDSRTKHDRYLLFKKKEDVTAYLGHENVPSDRFNAEDFVDYSTGFVENNGVSHLDTHKLSIKTNAYLDFKNDDYVFDIKYRIVWRIESIGIADDSQMKEYSLRPRKDTILNLIR
ncbi:MAG: hypothetical protein ACI35W_04035 [Anaeroplasmataceae bacterium]